MDLLSQPVLTADHRIAYGEGPSHFGDLWLPSGSAHAPVVVFFHGGWWKAEYDLGYAGQLCAAFKREGIACWSLEYRRVGEKGGGWPGTFQDAAEGFDHLASLAKLYPLDLSRVITMGHSAGGHLAFWIAGRHHVPSGSELHTKDPQIALRGAISLAGAVDLRLTIDLSGYLTFAHDKHEVFNLMGGRPDALPQRYKDGNPGDLLPFNVPQILIQGDSDDQIPPDLPLRWVELSRRTGDTANLRMVTGADHLDVADPASRCWSTVLAAVRSLTT